MASFRELAFQFSGNAEPLLQTLREIREQVKKTPKSQKIHIRAKTEQARQQLNEIEDKLEELDRESSSVEVTADIKKLVTQVAFARQIVAKLPTNKTISVELEERVNKDLARIEARVAAIMAGISRIGEKEERRRGVGGTAGVATGAAEAGLDAGVRGAQRLAQNFGVAAQAIRRLPPLLAGVTIILTGVLIPAFLALGSAIGGVVVAIGGLATALLAALGPAAVVIGGVIARLAKVMEARKSAQQAEDSETRRSVQVTRAKTQAEEQRRNAANRVRDALEQQATAQRALNDAQAGAREARTDAVDRLAEATREAARAQDELKRAGVEAMRAIEDAAEDASDALRAVESAQLGVEEANLSLREAQLALKELRKEAGATGPGIDDLFKKFTDVNVKIDTSAMRKAISSATGEGPDAEQQAIDLEQAILRVRRARLNVKEATDRESDAVREASRAQQEANRLRREGIMGVSSYRGAMEGLREATRAQADAQDELNKINARGIAGDPAVIAATEGLRDANQALAEARRDQVAQNRAADEALVAASGAAALAEDRTKKLTDAERDLLSVIDQVAKGFTGTLAPATDTVIGALARNLNRLAGAGKAAKGAFAGIGDAIAREIDSLTGLVLRPENLISFSGFAQASQDLTNLFGSAVRGALQSAINIAEAFMPSLITVFEDINHFFGNLAAGTADTGALKAKIEPMVEIFRLFGSILYEVARAFLGFFEGSSGPVTEFITWIRDGIRGFADFVSSAEGQEKIKDFFEDTLPFVKSFISTLFSIGGVVLKVVQIAMPLLKPLLDTFRFLVDVLGLLLGAVDWLIGPFKELFGVLISVVFGGGLIRKAFQWMFAVIGKFGKFIVGLFTNPKIREAAEGLVKFFRSRFGKVWDVLTWPFRKAFSWIRGAFGRARTQLGELAQSIINRVKTIWEGFLNLAAPVIAAFETVRDGVRRALGGLGDFVGDVFGTIGNVIKEVVNFGIRGVNHLINALNSIPDISTPFGNVGIPHINPIPLLAQGGITRGGALAVIGEGRYQEAVLPLSRHVFAQIAQGIVSAMRVSLPGTVVSPQITPALAAVGGGNMGTVIEEQHIHVPPAPGGAVPDARYVAVQLGREMKRRGT